MRERQRRPFRKERVRQIGQPKNSKKLLGYRWSSVAPRCSAQGSRIRTDKSAKDSAAGNRGTAKLPCASAARRAEARKVAAERVKNHTARAGGPGRTAAGSPKNTRHAKHRAMVK